MAKALRSAMTWLDMFLATTSDFFITLIAYTCFGSLFLWWKRVKL